MPTTSVSGHCYKFIWSQAVDPTAPLLKTTAHVSPKNRSYPKQRSWFWLCRMKQAMTSTRSHPGSEQKRQLLEIGTSWRSWRAAERRPFATFENSPLWSAHFLKTTAFNVSSDVKPLSSPQQKLLGTSRWQSSLEKAFEEAVSHKSRGLQRAIEAWRGLTLP